MAGPRGAGGGDPSSRWAGSPDPAREVCAGPLRHVAPDRGDGGDLCRPAPHRSSERIGAGGDEGSFGRGCGGGGANRPDGRGDRRDGERGHSPAPPDTA